MFVFGLTGHLPVFARLVDSMSLPFLPFVSSLGFGQTQSEWASSKL